MFALYALRYQKPIKVHFFTLSASNMKNAAFKRPVKPKCVKMMNWMEDFRVFEAFNRTKSQEEASRGQ